MIRNQYFGNRLFALVDHERNFFLTHYGAKISVNS